jgi:hypothetical protein
MPSVLRIILLTSVFLLRPANAEDTFTVLPQQAVSIGEGKGDSFMVERISPKENALVVLLRPKGEDCTFRFVVDVGQSVQLRIDTPLGQSFLCETTLRPIVDAQSVQFRAECAERPASQERKCPPTNGTTAAATH